MARPWIKLWLEILHDFKIVTLPEYLQLRFIKLLLLSEEIGGNGRLPSVDHIAHGWELGSGVSVSAKVLESLSAMKEVGVIDEDQQGWFVTNWDKRQSPNDPTAKERMRRYREKKKEEEDLVTRNVTRNRSISISSSLSDSDSLSNSSIGSAMSQFDDPTPRECERLYQLVTGQVCIPGAKRDEATESLTAILDNYKTPEAAQADGKAIFARWCNTRGKNGKAYSKVNPGWLTWWLDEMAPMPQVDQADELIRRVARDLAGGRR